MAFPKYQTKEVLNKVLNSGEDALNVDLADSVTVTVDSEFPAAAALSDDSSNPTTTSVGSHLLGYDSSNTNWNRVEVDDAGHLQIDVLSITAGDNNIGNVDIVSLPASTNTIEIVGDVAENENASGNPVLVGGRYDSPGNDNSSLRTLGDTDVGALALDPTGAAYVREALGQAGSCFVSGTSAVTAAYGKFVAIQFLEDTVFNSTDGLVATDTGRWPDDSGAASDISSSNTAAVGSQVFPQGMTIFGRWDSFILASGAVIAYVGNV